MGRGSREGQRAISAKGLLYGERPLGPGPQLRPIQPSKYRPLYNGLTALAIMGSCFTDLDSKIEIEIKLTSALAALLMKGESWGGQGIDLLDRAESALVGDIEDGQDSLGGRIPEIGQELNFSNEQNVHIRPEQDLIAQADQALKACYPDEFDSQDIICVIDTMTNLLHIARIRQIDPERLRERVINFAENA